MDLAAQQGHLEVMKFLYFNRNEKPSIRAINWATQYRHIEIVNWLNDITKGSSINVMVWVEERCILKCP